MTTDDAIDDRVRAHVAALKRELRDRADLAGGFERARAALAREVDAVRTEHERDGSAVPEIRFEDVATGSVPAAAVEAIRRRGCAIVRGTFARDVAEGWNRELGEYLSENDYFERAKEKAGLDTYFGDLADARPQIFGVYWSRPQVMARQAEEMATVKRFLNRLWDVAAPAGDEFDPDLDYSYADRTRRRAPGDTTLGLSPHVDAGSYERWVDPAFQAVYAPVFAGRVEDYDPWRAAFRTQTREYASPAVSSMFRTFQGWTALTPQGPGDGTLELCPVANAMGYILLRSLQDDVPEDELLLARPGRALGVDEAHHPDLWAGIVPIPLVEPGDTVWWHPDIVHAVGDEHAGDEYANVIYVGASPACTKNETYARRQAASFLEGRSPPDFAAEDYEVDFEGRATEADLTALGRAQMAL